MLLLLHFTFLHLYNLYSVSGNLPFYVYRIDQGAMRTFDVSSIEFLSFKDGFFSSLWTVKFEM